MRKFLTFLFGAAICSSAVSMTSCVQDDVAKAPEYSSRELTVEGVILVNDNIFEAPADQVWAAPKTEVEIEFVIPNSNLSDLGTYTTIVRTKCDASTGKYSATLPLGAQGANVTVKIKDFHGTITKENPAEPGTPNTISVTWYGLTDNMFIREGNTYFDTYYFDGNDSSAYTTF